MKTQPEALMAALDVFKLRRFNVQHIIMQHSAPLNTLCTYVFVHIQIPLPGSLYINVQFSSNPFDVFLQFAQSQYFTLNTTFEHVVFKLDYFLGQNCLLSFSQKLNFTERKKSSVGLCLESVYCCNHPMLNWKLL